jgi:hypothetical protein
MSAKGLDLGSPVELWNSGSNQKRQSRAQVYLPGVTATGVGEGLLAGETGPGVGHVTHVLGLWCKLSTSQHG